MVLGGTIYSAMDGPGGPILGGTTYSMTFQQHFVLPSEKLVSQVSSLKDVARSASDRKAETSASLYGGTGRKGIICRLASEKHRFAPK